MEKKEITDVTVGMLTINVLQRKVYYGRKEILVVKREFDFLYLLAATPGRVYTYSQIYQIISTRRLEKHYLLYGASIKTENATSGYKSS